MQIETTKVFKSGGSQAVRIPQSMRFPEGVDEIRITALDGKLVLEEKGNSLIDFFEKHRNTPIDRTFMKDREDAPIEFKDMF